MVCYRKSCALASGQGWLHHCLQGTHLSLTALLFTAFLTFPSFEGQRCQIFYCKMHRHSNLIANQDCYTFWHVLSYLHNENELYMLISGRNSIFMYKLLYLLSSKVADFLLLTWLWNDYCVTCKTSINYTHLVECSYEL